MKNLAFVFAVVSGLFALSCATKPYVDKETFASLTTDDEFTFLAKRANPMDYTAIQNVASSLPGAIPTRILELDYGYTLTLKKDSIKVNLPYFGRAYNASYGATNVGFFVETTSFTKTKKAGKKGEMVYQFHIHDKTNIQQMILEISPSGKAYLSIQANDRQPISYDGYIMKNEK